MVIRDLNVERITAFPLKANPPLIIDSNVILSFAVAAEFFESICRRYSQVIDVNGVIDHS